MKLAELDKRIVRIILVFLLISISFYEAHAQNIDNIVQQHLDAIGGLERWEKINTLVIRGVVSKKDVEMAVTVTKLMGKGMRFEYSLGNMRGFTMFTNREGWTYNSFHSEKPESLPSELVKQKQEHLDPQGLLVNYKKKGHHVSYDGIENQTGTDCYRVIVKSALGNVSIMYLDTSTYYCVKVIEKIVSNNQESEQATLYGNYRRLPEGIIFPMTIDVGSGPMTVSQVDINIPLPKNFFTCDYALDGK